MSERELRRAAILAQVKSGNWTLVEAAERMELSYRQVKRLWKRYESNGAIGLVHGSAGRVSNRAKAKKLRSKVARLIRQKYSGEVGIRFGPTLAAEHLCSEDQIELSASTVRRWMMAEGLWSRARKGRKHRQRRERREHFGELVQLDGSFHEWLEGRGPRGCLMDMVDDASGHCEARMGKEETIWAAAGVLRAWIENHGVPRALYTDWKNIYKRKATPAEQLRGKVPFTQFGRMCEKLGIGIIAASSPQAKGRIERANGVHQDRLIKKMRRKKIASYEAANQYLQKQYLPEHNRRFARPSTSPEDYHGRKPTARELHEIFRLETERSISNDWVIQHKGRSLQLKPGSRHYGPRQSKALVCEWEDGNMQIYYRGEPIAFTELKERVQASPELHPSAPRPIVIRKARKDHPWRQGYQNMRPRVPTPASAAPLVGMRTYASP